MKRFIALVAGTSIALGISAAAYAVSESVDGVDWVVDSAYLEEAEAGTSTTGAYGLDGTNISIALPTDHANPASFDGCDGVDTDEVELDGDLSVTCDDFQDTGIEGLEWKGSVKVFSGDYIGTLARQMVTIQNTSDATIDIDYEFYVNTEECDEGYGTTGTPDGDLVSEADEQWYACNNDNDALEGVAYGVGQNATDSSYLDDAADPILDAIDETGAGGIYAWNTESASIGAGDSINLVYFYRTVGAEEHGSTDELAETDAEFNAFMAAHFEDADALVTDSRLFEGISGGAANWVYVPVEDEELAETGVDASGIALGGALALAAGTAVAIRRRRRA